MTYEEISAMIERMGLPFNYYQWDEDQVPPLPYILFYYPERNDFRADDKSYCKITKLNLEFYSKEKDFENEEVIEGVLEEYGLIYTKTESFIDSERMYEVLYQTEVQING